MLEEKIRRWVYNYRADLGQWRYEFYTYLRRLESEIESKFFDKGCKATIESDQVQGLVEALEFYRGNSKWKGAKSEWDNAKLLTFDKFGCLDTDIMGPYIAEQALEKFRSEDPIPTKEGEHE